MPTYKGLLTAASMFHTLAMICYALAVLAIIGGLIFAVFISFGNGPIAGIVTVLPAAGGAIGAAAQGFFFQVAGELISAFRDIAVNSFPDLQR